MICVTFRVGNGVVDPIETSSNISSIGVDERIILKCEI
jgi:hypothetical protein